MVGMPPDFLQIKIRTDARPLGQLEISVNNARELGQEIELPRLVKIFEGFLYPGIWGGDIDVKASQRADGTLCCVRDHGAIMRVHHVCYFAGAQNAAHVERLDVDDVDGIKAQQLRYLLLRRKAFASCDGNVEVTRDFNDRLNISVRNRLFKPRGFERLQALADANGG